MVRDREAQRLESLALTDILDTPRDDAFDRITRLAATVMQTPMALISFIDDRRNWFKSTVGTTTIEAPRDVSICAHVIAGETAFVIPNLAEDARFSDNPLVTSHRHIRFYLGIPLRMHDGHNIGTLCVLDTKPREPTADQIEMLADLARLVVDELELRRMALTDGLTGALTRRGIQVQVHTELQRQARSGHAFSLLAIDIDHFKTINDRFGHATGDRVLKAVVAACQQALRGGDLVGRTGGDEFLVLLPETTAPTAAQVAERLRQTIATTTIATTAVPGNADVTASIGLITIPPTPDTDLDVALNQVDMALYSAKSQGRNRIVLA